MASDAVPASIIIPTLGRIELLRECLESVVACEPPASEVIVVVQGPPEPVVELVADFEEAGVRAVACTGFGRARGLNVGVKEAGNHVFLITDDDCRVSPSWVEVGFRQVSADAGLLLTGRVLPAGDPRLVPAKVTDPRPREYAGLEGWVAVNGCNMACSRGTLLSLGGFDELFGPAGEDSDLSYRWARAGKRIRYDPAFLIWHTAWRTPEEVEAAYVGYARALGRFYGKRLRRGDPAMLRSMGEQFYAGARGLIDDVMHRSDRWADHRRAILRELPSGLVEGWRRSTFQHRK